MIRLFKAIDDARNPIFDEGYVEIAQQAKTFICQPEIRKELFSVNRSENLDGLDLHAHLSSTMRPARNPVSIRTVS